MTTAEAVGLSQDQVFRLLGYTPTEAQKAIIEDQSRFQLVAGGFRGGKSQTAGVKGALATLAFLGIYGKQAVGQVAWLVAADYERNRAEFNYIYEFIRQFHPKVKASKRIDPGDITIPVPDPDNPKVPAGYFTIRTKSANDPHTLGMEAPVWIIVCEAAHVSVDVYERLLSRTSEARQRFPEFGWLHMEGTFEGSLGWYPSLWTKWQTPSIQKQLDCRSFSLPSHSNTVLYPGGENDPEILSLRASMPENAFAERHLGIPVPPSGRVHSAFDASVHIRELDYNPDLPVYLGIDPGYSGQPSTYAVEVAQLVPVGESGFKQWRVFDEIAMNKFSTANFSAADVCLAAQQRWWWKNPMKMGVIDIAGTQHNATSPDSNAEIWRKTTGIVLHHQSQAIRKQIDRMDLSLKQDVVSGEPGLLVDPKCALLISELGGGPNPFDGETHVYRWNENREGDVIGKLPRDQYCDGIKALSYLMLDVQGPAYANSENMQITVRSRRRRSGRVGKTRRFRLTSV